MRINTKLIFILTSIVLLSSCATRSGLRAIDLSHVYQKNGLMVRPKIRIFHENNYESTIHFAFSSDEMLYIRPSGDKPFGAHVDVSVFVYETFEKNSLIDTSFVTILDSQDVLKHKMITGSLPVTIPGVMQNESYVLLIRFHDRNRKLYFDEIRLLQRSDPLNRQNFLVVDENDQVVFSDHIELNQRYRIKSNQDLENLHVRYYDREFDLALPPFVKGEPKTFDFRADSTFSVANNGWFEVDKPGFYHFQTDATTNEGFTLYHYYRNYPLVTKKVHLIGPMRYLTSNLEFEGMDLKSEDSAKIAIDQFWIRHAGTEERARDQVEEFYERVEAANIFFSSFKQGWRTDRGVLYIVYGPPSQIYRTQDTETWVYGEEASSLNYTFVFDRMINPFTDNDFQLRRKAEYRYGWGIAIEAWRHGRIYDIEDIKRAQDERDQQLRRTAPPNLWY
ncbi:MAG: GWxTD domain-containing protein [Flavobacteriia bacterium]|nr:GWxTD domain-containing protein [Flavobacteriia bacterium]